MQNICVVGYKTGVSENAHVYGHTLSALKECCNEFRMWFNNTGNCKIPNFNGEHAPYDDEKNGFNFVTSGGKLQIELQLSRDKDDRTPTVSRVRFCPFCGAKIEVKETSVVRLKSKYKNVFAGYEEQKIGGK